MVSTGGGQARPRHVRAPRAGGGSITLVLVGHTGVRVALNGELVARHPVRGGHCTPESAECPATRMWLRPTPEDRPVLPGGGSSRAKPRRMRRARRCSLPGQHAREANRDGNRLPGVSAPTWGGRTVGRPDGHRYRRPAADCRTAPQPRDHDHQAHLLAKRAHPHHARAGQRRPATPTARPRGPNPPPRLEPAPQAVRPE